MTQSNTQHHWVEELFPPTFVLNENDVFGVKNIDDIDGLAGDPHQNGAESDKNQENTLSSSSKIKEAGAKASTRTSVFEKVARQISSLDVETVKNVYERVWLMMHLEEEARKKTSNADASSKPVGTLRKSPIMKDKQTSTADIDVDAPLDINDSCIWNSKEIDVLRSVFKAAKDDNRKLRAHQQETETQCQKLQDKYAKSKGLLEERTKSLQEATKANERLGILTQNLKQQVEESSGQISRLRKHVKDLQQERSQTLKEIHELRVEHDRVRLDRKKVELELQHQTQQAFRDERINRTNLQALHDEDVQFLQNTIDELTKELSTERKEHERTKRGLNHLRQHFSSLPLNDAKPTTVVKDDQLKGLNY